MDRGDVEVARIFAWHFGGRREIGLSFGDGGYATTDGDGGLLVRSASEVSGAHEIVSLDLEFAKDDGGLVNSALKDGVVVNTILGCGCYSVAGGSSYCEEHRARLLTLEGLAL